MNEFGCDIQLLAQLLNPLQSDENDESDLQTTANISPYTKPSDIVSPAKEKDEVEKSEPKKSELEEEYNNFNDVESSSYVAKNDWKKTPKWDISYRQQVSASDVFLQMGGKTPSTSSCENMIITIELPGENRQNIDLKVLKDSIEVNSPNFFLGIPLPHPVNPQHGNAQYDSEAEQMIVTLLMDREFDFVNF